MKISAALIVLNEVAYLRRCLDNLIGKVDEVVVVDGGSTDGTLDICQEYRDKSRDKVGGSLPTVFKVFEKKFEYNFRDQRNFSFQQCTGDWILMIDADEWFTADFYKILPQLINQSKYDAYTITRYNKYFEQMRNPILRFYKLRKFGYEGQTRLFRSYCHCAGGAIHEYATGYKSCQILPRSSGLLIHEKSLARQEYSDKIYQFLRKKKKPSLDTLGKKYNLDRRELD